MKHALYLAIFAVFVAVNLSAQFSVDRFYADGFKTFNLAMRTASFDGDSVFVPVTHWWRSSDECYSPDSHSILGREIRVSTNGLYQFVLAQDDTLKMRSQAALNETWIAWTSPFDDTSVQATVSSEETEIVMGEMELVKTISLQMLDENMEEVDASINFNEFRFGEESGLLSFPVLLSFPETEFFAFPMNSTFELVSIGESENLKDLTNFDVNDFQVGDQFHIEEGNSFFGVWTVYQFAEEVLSRTDYPDSIVYEIETRSWFYNGPSSGFDPQPVDTIIEVRTIVADSLFNLPAGAALVQADIFDEIEGGTLTWISQTEFGNAKNYYYGDPLFIFEGNSEEGCYQELIDWGCMNAPELYIENLGGPYFQCENGSPLAAWRELVYYNTSSSGEWGEPLNVSDLRVDESRIEIFPNPVQGEFRIGNDLNYSIQRVDVFDTQGRVVKSFSGNITPYDVGSLDSGIYLVVVNFSDGKFGSKKIVIQ